MKKTFAIILMFAMVCAMSLSVGAAPANFLQSPSYNKTPIIVDFECSDPNWKGDIFITSYGDRNVLDLVDREMLESAYDSIRDASNISSLIPDISGIASNLNVSPENLGISDLFHIGISDSTDGKFKIKLDSETIKNFVGLVYYENGQWHVVDGATIEDEYLVFTTELPRAFAVVVDVDNSIIDVPVTGDVVSWILISVIAVSAAGMIVLFVSYKRKNRA